MSELGPVVVRRTIDATQNTVWQQLIDADARNGWWPNSVISPEIGGDVQSNEMTGAVDVVVDTLTLGFRWRRPDDESDRTVVVMLRPEDEDFSQTRITVIESGFAVLPDAADAVAAATSQWEARFDTLSVEVAGEASGGDDSPGDTLEAVDESSEADDSEAVAEGELIDDTEPEEPVTSEEFSETVREDEVVEVVEIVDVEVDEEPEESIVTDDIVIDEAPVADETPTTGQRNIIEIVTEEVIDAETIDAGDALFLPEVSGAPYTESVMQITADLGVADPVEVDETSEWERLLRGDTIDD